MTSVVDSCLGYLSGALNESLLLELNLLLKLLSLHIWDQKGSHQILHYLSGLIMSLLNPVNDLIKSLDFELHLLIGLGRRGCVNGIREEILEVIINASLMNSHDVRVKLVFSLRKDHLGLSSAGLLSLSSSSVLLSHVDHRRNSSLLLESDQFVREGAHGVGNDFSL